MNFRKSLFSILVCLAGCATAADGDYGSEASDLTIRPFDHCDPGQPCPDLAIDVAKLKASVFIETRFIDGNSCSVREGEIGADGKRRLLRFTTGAKNKGTADLFLGDPAHGDPKYFELAKCHGHYHFKGFADYQLLKMDRTLAVQGHKMSFCVEDNEAPGPGEGNAKLVPRPNEVPMGSPPPPDHWTPAMRTYCHHPGLHRGWEDAYANTIEGNWLDITGVLPGDYILSVTLNPEHFIAELSFDNNHSEVKVHIPDQSADGAICPPNLEAIFRCQDDHTRTKCLRGKTISEACAHGTTCRQPEESAHPGKCFPNSALVSSAPLVPSVPTISSPTPVSADQASPWTADSTDDTDAISEPGDPTLQ